MATQVRIKRAAPVVAKSAPVVVPDEDEEELLEAESEADEDEAEELEDEDILDDEEDDDEDELDEDEMDEDASAYSELSLLDLRSELGGRGLNAEGRKSELIKRLMISDEEEAAKLKAKAKKSAAVVTKTSKPAPVAKVAPPTTQTKTAPVKATEVKAKVKTAPAPTPVAPVVPPKATPVKVPASEAKAATTTTAIAVVTGSLASMMESMENGNTVLITRTGDDTWTMELGAAQKVSAAGKAAKNNGLRGDAFDQEVMTPEFYRFMNVDSGTGKPWKSMTKEEKFSYADKTLKVKYQTYDDERVTMLRMVEAVQKALGLQKYKPEYAASKARDAVRG